MSRCLAPITIKNANDAEAATKVSFPARFQLFHSGGVIMKVFN